MRENIIINQWLTKDCFTKVKKDRKPQLTVFEQTLINHCQMQYAKNTGAPMMPWNHALRDNFLKPTYFDREKLHYVKPDTPILMVDIDTDNIEDAIAIANTFPPTYCEFSKSQTGLHLYYTLSEYSTDTRYKKHLRGAEIKTYPRGGASIRRKLTYYYEPLDHLPDYQDIDILERDSRVGAQYMKADGLGIRNLDHAHKMIMKACKGYFTDMPTVSACSFISAILNEIYHNDKIPPYNMTPWKPVAIEFASKSTNSAERAIEYIENAKWKKVKDNE